jgi:hypothetical protein
VEAGAADPATSFLSLPNVDDNLHCGKVHSINCTILDSEKNLVLDSTTELEAILSGPRVLDGFITRQDPGVYQIEYFPTRPGKVTAAFSVF